MPTYTENYLEKIEVQEPLRSGVPFICDDWTLAFRLGFTGKALWYILLNRRSLYHEFMVKKKSGGLRRTFDPAAVMRVFQSQMRARLLLPLCRALGAQVTAYQEDKGTVDAVRQHLRPCTICDESTKPGTKNIAHRCPRMGTKFKLDLKDFFLSTSQAMIRDYFHKEVGYNHYVSSLLATLLTTEYTDAKGKHRAGVPPGALTAGDICNLVADKRLDRPMMKAFPGWIYTRYADDLYFSTDKVLSKGETKKAINKAISVIRFSGYRVNPEKIQAQPWSKAQRILGINLNRKLNIPNGEFQRMHHVLYHAKKHGFEYSVKKNEKTDVVQLHHWIAGKLNYFKQFAPEKVQKLVKLYEEAKAAHPTSMASMFEFTPDKGVVAVGGETSAPPFEHPLPEKESA